MNPTSRRPITHAERATCAAAVDRLKAWPNLSPLFAAMITHSFTPLLAAYLTARQNNDGAAIKAAKASDDKDAAVAAVLAALRTWAFSLYSVVGMTAGLAELTPILGNRAPSALAGIGARSLLSGLARLLQLPDERPAFAGDAAAFKALREAIAKLSTVADAWEAAVSTRARTRKVLAVATVSFDRSYGVLVRAVVAADPSGAGSVFPVFHRTPSGGTGSGSPVAAAPPASVPPPPPAVDPEQVDASAEPSEDAPES